MRESPHTTGLQHPHHPCLTSSLTSGIEREKKAAAAGPRFLLFFPSARRAAPRRTARGMTCLLGGPPPFGRKSRGELGEDVGLFCLPRCDQPGDRRLPSRPAMDGLTGHTLSCRAAIWGVTTPECCNLFFSELGGCRGLSYCPPVWESSRTIGGACPAGWCAPWKPAIVVVARLCPITTMRPGGCTGAADIIYHF